MIHFILYVKSTTARTKYRVANVSQLNVKLQCANAQKCLHILLPYVRMSTMHTRIYIHI